MFETITIYLDSDFKCHAENTEGLTPYETDFFNGREELIPFYRVVPEGSVWTREDGVVFTGEMITLV